jgi:hypothetical protein
LAKGGFPVLLSEFGSTDEVGSPEPPFFSARGQITKAGREHHQAGLTSTPTERTTEANIRHIDHVELNLAVLDASQQVANVQIVVIDAGAMDLR